MGSRRVMKRFLKHCVSGNFYTYDFFYQFILPIHIFERYILYLYFSYIICFILIYPTENSNISGLMEKKTICITGIGWGVRPRVKVVIVYYCDQFEYKLLTF